MAQRPFCVLEDVMDTEFELCSAGGETFGLPGAVGTRDCEWSDQPGSHVILPDTPRTDDFEVAPRDLPCSHDYEMFHTFHTTRGITAGYTAMALPLKAAPFEVRKSQVELECVEDDAGWSVMKYVRAEVERAFEDDEYKARRMVDHIRHRQRDLHGNWFLAKVGAKSNTIVGEIGLFCIETAAGRLGRLQDVDILPRFQGNGLGDSLLDAAIAEARRRGCAALCLRANAEGWPRRWYARRGFVEVGGWTNSFIKR